MKQQNVIYTYYIHLESQPSRKWILFGHYPDTNILPLKYVYNETIRQWCIIRLHYKYIIISK